MEGSDVCEMSLSLSQLEKRSNGNKDANGTDWTKAMCADTSDSDLRQRAESSNFTWPVNRGDAVKICADKLGSPSLMVDGAQNCKCCPILCSKGSAKLHSCCGNSYGNESSFEDRPVDDAFAEC